MVKFAQFLLQEVKHRVVINWGSSVLGLGAIFASLSSTSSIQEKAAVILVGSLGVIMKNTSVK